MCWISTDSIPISNLLGYNQSRECLNFRFLWSSQDRMRIGQNPCSFTLTQKEKKNAEENPHRASTGFLEVLK